MKTETTISIAPLLEDIRLFERIPQGIIESAEREVLPLPVTGIILCGGRSKRMGLPKAFLPFEGKTIIENLLDRFNSLFDEVFLVTNEPDTFSHLSVNVVKDILPYRGPVCGILSGLLVARNSHAFVVACDMPLVDKKIIRQMCSQRHDADVLVLAHEDGVEPLLGLYAKSCIKSMEEALFTDNLAVSDLLDGLKAKTYLCQEAPTKQLPSYFNVNTPQDYSQLLNVVT